MYAYVIYKSNLLIEWKNNCIRQNLRDKTILICKETVCLNIDIHSITTLYFEKVINSLN